MIETLCSFADSDTPSRYVAQTLPAAESAAFEEHYFSCQSCWQEVQTGSVVRSVFMDVQPELKSRRPAEHSPLSPAQVHRDGERVRVRGEWPGTPAAPASRKWWMGLAAAAVIAAIGLVTVRERTERNMPDVLRGDSQHTMAVQAQRAAAQVQIRWHAVPRAARYEVAMRGAEGEVLQQESSVATTLAFDGASGREVFIRVTAYDAQGEEIARSAFVRVPPR